MKNYLYPKTTNAAILTELKSPLIIAEIEIPQELKVGQVLVKVHYSGICGSQLGEIDGAKGEDKYLPHLLGHEASGTVIYIGPGVTRVKTGQKVVLHWRKGAGIEGELPNYMWNGKKVNAGWVTTFSEYSIVSENRMTVIPENSNLEVAALFGCAVTTGFGVIENNAKLRIGESVVVFGAGGIGLNVIQAADMVSAYPIIAVDTYDNRLELAKQMGATHTINSARTDATVAIAEIMQQAKVDVFIDNTGAPAIIQLGYSITKPQGRVILVGVPKAGNNISIFSLPLHFGKVLTGSQGGNCQPNEDIPRLFNLFNQDKMKLKELITNIYSLDEINTAIASIRNGTIQGRCMIRM
jgi:S-(hydroxymethyl)glutathione dehydrogenase/alcohol dehydrogenase